jgi:outer membrane protein
MIGSFLLLASTGFASAERPLSYDEALDGAVRSNPVVAQAQVAEEQARAALTTAWGPFDPSLLVEGQWSRSSQRGFLQGYPFAVTSRGWDLGTSVGGALPTGTQYALSTVLESDYSRYVTDFGGAEGETIQDAYTANVYASVTQELLRGSRMSYNLQNVTLARLAIDAAHLSGEQQRQQALATTSEAYWTWVYRVRLEAISAEAVTVAREALRVGAVRVAAGDLAPVERTRLEAALVQAEADTLDASNLSRDAADALLLLMGETPGQDVLPATEPGAVPDLPLDVQKAVEVALVQNLDLALARSDVETARAEATHARRATRPSLAVTGAAGAGAQDITPGAAAAGLFADDAVPTVLVGGAFAVPLGNRTARGGRDTAVAALRSAELTVIALERSVRAQVEQQVRILTSARRRVELADANLRLAIETLAAEEALATAGRSIQRDVLLARNSADLARAEVAKAQTDYRVAQSELLRLQGQL